MGRPVVEPPKKVGLWTVYERVEDHVGKVRYPMYRCVCECGTEKAIAAQSLRRGDAYSCGCKKRISLKKVGDKRKGGHTIHGMKNTPEYMTWSNMKDRCLNPNSCSYPHYGARGITVCDEWKGSFLAFYEHLGPRPGGHSLDRIDVNGNYEPGNVRWAPEEDQCNNRTNARALTVNGETKTIAQWSRITGIPYSAIWTRKKYGWSDEMALSLEVDPGRSTKPRHNVRLITCNNKTMSVTEWSKETGIAYDTIRDRLNRGWSPERALEIDAEETMCYN